MASYSVALIIGAVIVLLESAIIPRLMEKYERRKVFVYWTITAISIWAICYTGQSIFHKESYIPELSIWQYIIIYDVLSYAFFLLYFLFFYNKKN